METRRWINHSLPQTLGNAVLLLYVSAAFDVLSLSLFGFIFAAGKVAAGYLIANEQRSGYKLGVAMALLPFVLRFLVLGLDGVFGVNILGLLFEIVLVVLLLHPKSQEHQRIWFS